MLLLGVAAASASAMYAKDDPRTVETVIVADAEQEGRRSDASDIVVTGIKVDVQDVESGVLQNRSILETPFSLSTFDETLIENLNVRSLNQVLRFDPSVQVATSDSGFGDFVDIRGFEANILYAGLAGFDAGVGRISVPNIARVEVFRGVNNLSENASPFVSIGGTINQVPKTPADVPITEVTLGYDMDSQFSAQMDVSRRFAGDRFGVRVNLYALNGDTNIDAFSRESLSAVVNADWRITDTLTLNAEFGAYRDFVDGYRDGITFDEALITSLPRPPKNDSQYGQAWQRNGGDATRYFVDLDWRPVDGWSLNATLGRRESSGFTRYGAQAPADANGNVGAFAFDGFPKGEVVTGQITGRGRFDTGPIEHRPTLAYGFFEQEFSGLERSLGQVGTTNIYDPVVIATPDFSGVPFTSYGGEQRAETLTAFDDFRLFDGKLAFIAGVRHTRIKGDEVTDATNPIGAVNVFFSKAATIYLSYGEGIEPGSRVEVNPLITNSGELLPVRNVRQLELGGKIELGGLFMTAALFDLEQPLEYLRQNEDDTSTFVQEGRRVHRGVELRVQGSPVEGVRVIAGGSYIDARIKDNGMPEQEGNRAPAVPELRGSLYGEYDVSTLPGLTASAGVLAFGRSKYDLDNRISVPGWAQLDIGARYAFDVGGRQVIARATIDNVTDGSNWRPSTYNNLNLSTPRTLRTSVTVAF